MPGSADTGAREPQDSVARSAKIAETREVLRNALASTQVGNSGWNEARDALDTLCALAAGVGVPPDADLGCAPAKERQDARATPDFGRWFKESATWTGSDYLWLNRFRDLYLASGASAAEGRLPNTAENSLAGVGEARPAEPEPDCGCAYELVEDGAVQRKRWFHEPGCALAAGVGEARPAEDDYFKSYGEIVHELTEANRERDRLREQLDAARHALDVVRVALGVVGPPPTCYCDGDERGHPQGATCPKGEYAVSAPSKNEGRAGGDS